MERITVILAIAVLLPLTGSACERSVGDDGNAVAPTSYDNAIRGCIHWSICNGFAGSIDSCNTEFEWFYLIATPAEREALNRSYTCLANATSCENVAACNPGQCASLRTCEGDTLVTCVRGYEVRVPCGDARTSGPICIVRDDGEATCGHRACTPDDIARDDWCEGSTLLECRHGVVEALDCQTLPGQSACDDTQTYAGCTEALGEACDRDSFVAHCDGAEVVECVGQETRYDCSLWAHHSTCVEIEGVPLCGSPDATTPCATSCLGNVLRFCAYDVSVDVDCATFSQVCDDSSGPPTCR